ncbi:MAG: 2-C-methyl-D-erythritol 2,4-cyclodiphosphate synthase [Candidatus Aminicenantes bacterium]|nr:2-C-methyl-D-erythritol 2,4-cyclodiphosphate synthase [Candidatus Aminicenantes bacterium]
MRTGIGFDIHRLVDGRDLYLGGIAVPYHKGLLGHSDGDCLIHAIADALLGAMGEKDIGQQFPDKDMSFKDVRSTKLLETVVKLMERKKVRIANIDSVVIAEKPQLASHIPKMKDVLCRILKLQAESLGIKARTHEGLGPIGRGEAIAAWATVLLFFEEG